MDTTQTIRIDTDDNVTMVRGQSLGGKLMPVDRITINGLMPEGDKAALASARSANRCGVTTASSAT